MGRTIHRTPLTVSTNPGIKYEFFNHANWNGLCDDKNYLNVNQETFEDCNNVYIDENNLLKSRPSLKIQPELNTGDNINNVWKFDNITCWIDFLIQDDAHLYISNGISTKSHYLSSQKIFIFKYGDRIFVFTDVDTFYIDNYLNLVPADEFIYLPVRYTHVNGVRSERIVETDNLLTSGYRERFVYNNINRISNPIYRNKEVTVEVDGDKNTYTFTDGSENVIFFKQFSISNENYLLDISDVGNMILSTYSTVTDAGIKYKVYNIKHSVDGKTFTDLTSTVGKTYGIPMISRDGTFVVVFKSDGPYALSLLADTETGSYRFPDWTNLFTYNGIINSDDEYLAGKTLYFHLDNSVGDKISGQFLNFNTFGFAYGNTNQHRLQFVLVNDSIVEVDDYDSIIYKYVVTNTVPRIKVVKTDKTHLLVIETGANYEYNSYERIYNLTKDSGINFVDIYLNDYAYEEPDCYDVKLITDDVLQVIVNNSVYTINKNVLSDNIKNINASNATYYRFINANDIVTDREYILGPNYNTRVNIPITASSLYVANNDIWIVDYDRDVYSNVIGNNTVIVDVNNYGKINHVVFDDEVQLDRKYCSKDDTLYISSITADDTDKYKYLYFPKINNQKFDKKITNLHPVSESQVAIFFDDQVWYSQITEQGYAYYKSKLQVGLENGADVITSPDGKNIIFPTERGLVYLGYQELVQSTEQTLTFLSDTIQTHWKNFVTKPVKLLLHKYWLYCYNENEKVLYVFDIRNNSWWKWTIPDGVIKIKHIVIPIFIVNKSGGTVMKLDDGFENYFDYDNNLIDWHFTSQKLHLGTLNYYKNVNSIIINNVEYEDVKRDVSYNLDIKNYRITSSYRYEEPKNFTYKVDMLRTFVKRCNSRKVNEFQYTLSSDTGDNGDMIQLPLSIHSIIIKYTVSGQVR